MPEVTGVTEESYRAQVDALADFLGGNTKPVLTRLDTQMQEAAARQEYEQAAKLRDQLGGRAPRDGGAGDGAVAARRTST